MLLQTGEGSFKIIDGSITNCRLPHPDWQIIAHTISLDNKNASTSNAFFEFLGVPVFYFPYLHHPATDTGRVSGLLTPVISTGSSIRGYTFGEQVYWAINRSMDVVIGSEYYSKRGWAPNGDFRYKGPGLDHLIARWNALLDRGVEEMETLSANSADSRAQRTPAKWPVSLVNQGGVDVTVQGRKDISRSNTASPVRQNIFRATSTGWSSTTTTRRPSAPKWQATWSSRTIATAWFPRSGSIASRRSPTLRAETKLRSCVCRSYATTSSIGRLGSSPLYWGLGSSIGYLNRSEPSFHVRNVGRLDFYPHLSMPISVGGWSFVPEAALRDTEYTISQTPTLTGTNIVPAISHDPLNRKDIEASIDIRPPALERDFEIPRWHRELRHVIESEFNYRYVRGIGAQARNVLLFDTTDVATNVNEAGFSLTQRFYLRPTDQQPCKESGEAETESENVQNSQKTCPSPQREWASWRIAQEYFIDPNFGGALIPGRRNVFDATLDLMAPTFLTSPRNIAPIDSRMRFEAIPNLRVEWDLDYDTIAGNFAANNLFAGYSFGRTTLGIGHALLNALDETPGNSSTPATIKSQQLQPFLEIGKPSGNGFNLAANGGYDFVEHQLQYGGVQVAYNWNCCGLTVGYRRFELGTIGSTSRDETQWLYSFTLANFGGVGDIRRANSVFRDAALPPVY